MCGRIAQWWWRNFWCRNYRISCFETYFTALYYKNLEHMHLKNVYTTSNYHFHLPHLPLWTVWVFRVTLSMCVWFFSGLVFIFNNMFWNHLWNRRFCLLYLVETISADCLGGSMDIEMEHIAPLAFRFWWFMTRWRKWRGRWLLNFDLNFHLIL